jgi:hypothetical protein
VDAQLSDLLRKEMDAYQIPKQIEERLRAFSERAR